MKLTSRDRALLGVVAALILCVVLYKLVLAPERRTDARLQTQVAAEQAKLARTQQQEADGHSAEVALRASESNWSATQRAVPNVSNVPALLKLLARSAAAAHVSMQSISLSGGSGSSTTTASAPSNAAGATTIPVSLSFSGGYQALDRLVDRLDQFVTVSHRKIRATGPLVGIAAVDVSPAPTTSDPSKLNVQLTATIYQRSAASTAASGSTEATG